MSPSKMLEEVWRWKEEVAREVENMTRDEQLQYFRQALQRLAEKTGKVLHLPKIINKPKKTANDG
ncbi:MAG: hypothetical protein JXB10_01030 [Pirellulales bacterium]|nr:hypothetical protein [Pirellulales bacterium]